jgi:hypothetical protein
MRMLNVDALGSARKKILGSTAGQDTALMVGSGRLTSGGLEEFIDAKEGGWSSYHEDVGGAMQSVIRRLSNSLCPFGRNPWRDTWV